MCPNILKKSWSDSASPKQFYNYIQWEPPFPIGVQVFLGHFEPLAFYNFFQNGQKKLN